MKEFIIGVAILLMAVGFVMLLMAEGSIDLEQDRVIYEDS